jgi:hypothetical protein
MSITVTQAEILRQFEAGTPIKEIAKNINWKASDVRACIELHSKRLDLQLGWKGMLQLAREAGLIK